MTVSMLSTSGVANFWSRGENDIREFNRSIHVSIPEYGNTIILASAGRTNPPSRRRLVRCGFPLSRTAGEGWDPSRSDGKGEGLARGLVRQQNGLDHTLGIAQNVIVSEPDHAPALAFEQHRAPFVRHILRVLAAIRLDDEVVSGAGEVGDIIANRMLPAKLEAGQPTIP